MNYSKDQLKQFLLDTALISKTDIEAAEKKAEEAGRTIGDVLVSDGKISEDDFRQVEAHILGIPFVNLKGQAIDPTLLSLIPEPVARKHNIAAYQKEGEMLFVAMLDPQDFEALEFLKKATNLKPFPRLTDTESMKYVLAQYRKSLSAEFGNLIKQEAGKITALPNAPEGGEVDEKELKKLAEDVPVVKIVDSILSHAIVQRASDIHIESFEGEVITRYRIDGILHDVMTLPKNVGPGLVARIKVLAGLRLDEKRLPQDGRFKIETNDQKVSFRVSTLPTYFGEKIVMRLLVEQAKGFTLEALGFHGTQLEALHEAMRQTTGLILTTGPTGSGKTTTLYTMLDILNTPEVNISTIEDPVEYQMQRVNQTQVKPEIGFSFPQGLRTLVRQDPDIIMVGEIRDGETINLAINASLTGHLVLSTLHTNSAAGAMPRMIDMGAEPFLIVSTVRIVIGQRLVRKLVGAKEEYKLSDEEIESIKKHADLDKLLALLKEENIVDGRASWKTISFYKPKENAETPDGYSGRIGIYEVLPISRATKELIMKSASADVIGDQAKKEGVTTMFEDGIFKSAQGLTTIEEVLRVTQE
jgi:type IV pilus assembly protein PilB